MTEIELLEQLNYLVGTLVVMKICEWVVTGAKWIHDWLSSLFPTSGGK